MRGHPGGSLEQPREVIRAHVRHRTELREPKLSPEIALDVLRHAPEPALGKPSTGDALQMRFTRPAGKLNPGIGGTVTDAAHGYSESLGLGPTVEIVSRVFSPSASAINNKR